MPKGPEGAGAEDERLHRIHTIASRVLVRCSISAICYLLLAAGLSGCNEDLVAREHYEAPFSIYGVLSPQLDTQSIRVYPVEDFLTLGSPSRLEADVFSIDVETDERATWRDSVVVDPKGQFGHIYWAPFRAAYGHRYRVEVIRRSDGARSSAEVRVPDQPEITMLEEENAGSVRILIHGDDFRALKPEAEYKVSKPAGPVLTYPVSYQGLEEKTNAGWQVNVKMVVDAYDINFLYNGDAGTLGGSCRLDFVHLESFRFLVLIGDTAWDPPGGMFNPDLISNPNILRNVNNGFGFLGAGFRIEKKLFPSPDAVADACFIDALERSMAP